MILAIDVGNTNIVIGGIERDNILFQARYSTDRAKTEDEYALMFMDMFRLENVSPDAIEGGIISSVVPELRKALRLAIKKVTGKWLMVVGPEITTGITIDMDIPGQLGSDQIADAIAALAKYPTPILIFDMGTATTLSVIDKDGVYRGGMIIPGLKLSVEALYTKTSLLPRISLEKTAASDRQKYDRLHESGSDLRKRGYDGRPDRQDGRGTWRKGDRCSDGRSDLRGGPLL